MAFFGIFLITNEAEQVFMHLLALWVSSSLNCFMPIHVLAHFSIEFFEIFLICRKFFI